MTERLKVRVEAVCTEADAIRSYLLADPRGVALPRFTPGAHIDVFLASGLVRQYSLCNDPTSASYLIAVQREENGRGGSKELHDHISPGDLLEISAPRNTFSIAWDARRHVFIAGGIGITPILSMVRTLAREDAVWELYYCVRDRSKAAFLKALGTGALASRSVLHVDGGDPSRGLDVERIASIVRAAGTHLYCCGPVGLMDRVRIACRDWPEGTVHFESFEASKGSDADSSFEIEIAGTGQVFTVPPGETILNVLVSNGVEIPWLCTQGVCGTCVVDVLEGVPDHRDSVLFEHERPHKIATCCSRAVSGRLKLAL